MMPSEAEALTAPIDWQELQEGCHLILGDLQQLATKHGRTDVARVVQIVELLAANPAMSQLVATGINLLRQRFIK